MIIIRVEDRKEFGQGHRSRAIALAQACERQQLAYKILASDEDWSGELSAQHISVDLLKNDGGDSDEETAFISNLTQYEVCCVIIDGGRFSPGFIRTLSDHGFRVAVIDDNGLVPKTSAWCVINPNIYATADLYEREWKIRSYTGPNYILLREAFILQEQIKKEDNLVSMALGVSAGKELVEKLTSAISNMGYHVVIAQGLSSTEMVSLIDRSHLVICGASVTLHEVWARNRAALPVYQAKDQVLFADFLSDYHIPYVTSLGKDAKEVCDRIIHHIKYMEILIPVSAASINRNGADLVIKTVSDK